MNEIINFLNLNTNSNERISLTLSNISGQDSSFIASGIKDIGLKNLNNIIINNNIYKEITIGQNNEKIIGNEGAGILLNNLGWIFEYADASDLVADANEGGVYVNGIRFVPTEIVVDGVTKLALVAEE